MQIRMGLQPRLDDAGFLQDHLSGFFGFIPQQPPQQFPTRVLWDNVNKRDPSGQVLIRRLRIRNMLTNDNGAHQNGPLVYDVVHERIPWRSVPSQASLLPV